MIGPFDPHNSQNAGSTAYTVGGIGWYHKHFRVPEPADDRAASHVELRFDGVYQNADVWLNGVHLGFHPYGYTSFAYDLTPYLNLRGERARGPRRQQRLHVTPRPILALADDAASPAGRRTVPGVRRWGNDRHRSASAVGPSSWHRRTGPAEGGLRSTARTREHLVRSPRRSPAPAPPHRIGCTVCCSSWECSERQRALVIRALRPCWFRNEPAACEGTLGQRAGPGSAPSAHPVSAANRST